MLINTNGLALIGPGSEWFWSMLQFVVVAVTLVGIYYQLRSSQSANAFTQLGALVDEWNSERLVRKRMAVILALRDGAVQADIPSSPANAVANYWEKVGALVRAGHIPASLIAEGMGFTNDWWGILAPFVRSQRTEDANPNLWEHFEWLAGTLVRIHPAAAFDQQLFGRTLEERIAAYEADLRDLEAMRALTVRLTPTPIPVTGIPPAAR
jgi:hypothetical protein